MTARMTGAKHLLQLITPPSLWSVGQALRRRFDNAADHLEYAPDGWATPLPAGNAETFWNAFLAQEHEVYDALVARIKNGDANTSVQPDEHLKYFVFDSALTSVASGKQRISILDYGGNFGDYAWIARSWLPAVAIDFHCRELPTVVEVAQPVNPTVAWHSDDQCLDARYDLVMFASSVQCLPTWAKTLQRSAAATRDMLLVLDVPAVRGVPSFVSTQRSRGRTTLYNVVNRDELVDRVKQAGLRLVREFDMGAHPPIAKAPEQPRCLGLLFRR